MASTTLNESIGEAEPVEEASIPQSSSRSTNPAPQHEPRCSRKNVSQPHSKSGENKLRPAADIVNRITWDPTFKRSDYIIAFLDRFEGQLEINMGNWKKESTDEEFIPQHRILFIKHVNGEIVWDRRRRIDKIFNSGNSAFSELAFLM